MRPFAPRNTSLGVSFGWAFSGTGLLMLACLAAFLGLVRFIVWMFESNGGAVTAAGVVVFGVLGAAYLLRYVLVATQAVAEGFDLVPGMPDPREAELVFGAFFAFLGLAFLAFLPLVLALTFGLDTSPVPEILMGLGALYVPMAVVGLAVREALTGSLPGGVVPAILSAGLRYLAPGILAAGAGLCFYVGRDGTFGRHPSLLLLTGVDLVGGWLLMAALHRAAVLHREEPGVKAALPPAEAPAPISGEAVPRGPVSDIERILRERERANSE